MNHPRNRKAAEIVSAAALLRSKKAKARDIDRTALEHYPGADSTARAMRARLRRLVGAPDDAFANAVCAMKEGRNINQVVECTPPLTLRGAPPGNKNAYGKRVHAMVDRLYDLWREASPAEKEQFLELVQDDASSNQSNYTRR